MTRLPAALLLAVLSLAAIAAEPVQLDSRFDLDEVKFVREAGTATVHGTAALKLKDGSAKGCAGFPVELLPVAKYSNERILRTYRSNEHGQVLLEDHPPKFTPDTKEYHEYLLKAVCDERGEFRFEKVPAGDYYVMVFIIWDVTQDGATRKQGGAVMHRIQVKAGATLPLKLGEDSR
jgi:hypothetical protein